MIRHSLFISSFNNKRIRNICLVLIIMIFFMLGNKVLNYLYVEDYMWGRILWHNFYNQTENIDYIYLGSSHVYCDLNPEILDKKTGKSNFNMSTGSQRLIDSYYCLKEADKYNKIEKVYLELFYNPSTGVFGNYGEKGSMQIGWRTMDGMRNSFTRMEALIAINPLRYYGEALFPFVRYREHLMDGEWIKQRVSAKETEEYKKYIHQTETEEYTDKGYLYRTSEMSYALQGRDRTPEEMYLTTDAEAYLRKIIEYCQKREVSITLFSSPFYECWVMSTNEYDRYANQIKEIAKEYGIPYYDFNMAKEEYLPIQYREYFADMGHLNAKGAEMYTDFFYQVVSESPENAAEYFCDSYREKLEESKPRVYGMYCYDLTKEELPENDESGKTRKMVIASNREKELEYQIFLTPDNEDTTLLQDFSINKEFNILPEEHGVCKIVWRNINNRTMTESIEVRY